MNLDVLEIPLVDKQAAIYEAGEDFYLVYVKYKPTGTVFQIHIGPKESPRPNAYQRISREPGQKEFIYIFEKSVFKRLKPSNEKEEETARSIMLMELDGDFKKISAATQI